MMDKNKKYLITGGSGYLGKELVKRLVSEGIMNLVVVSRNEGELIKLKEEYPTVEIITGDITAKTTCWKACKGVSGIFHLAAFKHVGLAEKNVRQCIYSNVQGSLNLLEMTLDKKAIEFIIGISTDKAAQVRGVYGATKLLMEKLFHEFETMNPDTKYRLVRYGNVLDSTGSVTTIWRKRLQDHQPLVITDPEATRFYWTVKEAVDLIFRCLDEAINCTPHKALMKAMKLGDLLKAVASKYGDKNKNYTINQVGLQTGENMHETIDGVSDSSQAEQYTIEEIIEMI